VENAHYWIGECYVAKGNDAQAAREFEALLSRFGGGNKAPDALLKLSSVYERMGARDAAQSAVQRLRREFPKSDAARKLPRRPTVGKENP